MPASIDPPEGSRAYRDPLSASIAAASTVPGPGAGVERASPLLSGPLRRPGSERSRELKFVRRMHRMRTLGLGLGFLAIASVLVMHDAPLPWWILLGANAFVWPHAAWWLATSSSDPRRTELRNLIADSVLGGVWIAVMQFNLLPSVLLAGVHSLDRVSVGGASLLGRSFLLLLGGCAVTSAALGFPVSVATPMSVILACIPLLVFYPLVVSATTYSLARRLARQNRRLDEWGRTDALTGLANRRQCFMLAETELARHFRTGRPASLLILDVDRFKEINDRYGHPVGDAVLCAVADVLRECSRETDTAGRLGGDEFLLMLPETDLRGAEEAARRIRRQLAGLKLEIAPDLRCTVSLGGAEAGLDITNVEVWIQQADAALYRAKAAGRDRFAGAPAVSS